MTEGAELKFTYAMKWSTKYGVLVFCEYVCDGRLSDYCNTPIDLLWKRFVDVGLFKPVCTPIICSRIVYVELLASS